MIWVESDIFGDHRGGIVVIRHSRGARNFIKTFDGTITVLDDLEVLVGINGGSQWCSLVFEHGTDLVGERIQKSEFFFFFKNSKIV